MARRDQESNSEIDMVPIMNLVSILIPFLLLGTSFVELAVVDTTLPGITDDSAPVIPLPELRLSVVVSDQGLRVLGAEDVLSQDAEGEGVFIPCTTQSCVEDDSYDYVELTRVLGLVKDEYPDSEDLILLPEGRVPYNSLIGVMDAARDDPTNGGRRMFPYQTVAGGVK